MKKSKGFTLVELLVTTSVIGIIMSVGLVIYQGSRQKARDARRREDLLTIQKAMEQYFAVEETYPDGCPAAGASFSTTGGDVILDSTPDDPDDDRNYSGDCDAQRYCYSVQLDNTDAGNCGGCSCGAGDDFCSFSAGTDYFCVKHMQ